jgi:hypothetical protein
MYVVSNLLLLKLLITAQTSFLILEFSRNEVKNKNRILKVIHY